MKNAGDVCVRLVVMFLFVEMIGCATACKEGAGAPKSIRLGGVLACRMANYGKYQDAGWRHLPTIGVRHVLINVPAPDQVEATKKKLTAHGLTAAVLRGNADLSKESCVESLARQAATCEKMGVKLMFLSAKRHDAPKEVACERLRRAGEAARKHDVTIVLETHPDMNTNAAVGLETMRRINHPNIRINFDTGNIYFYNQGTTAVAELKKIIDYVAAVELKDHTGKLKEWNFPALGKGVVEFPEVIRILNEHGYRGPFTMEMEGVKGVTMTKAETLQYVADSARYIQSLGEFQ